MLNRKIPKKLQQNQDKVCMHHWGLIYTPSLQTAIDSRNIKTTSLTDFVTECKYNVRLGVLTKLKMTIISNTNPSRFQNI